MSDIPLIGRKPEAPQRIEVCRSYSYKLNLANHGGPQYESADFFASRKMECDYEVRELVSQELYEECVAEVRAAVVTFIDEMRRKVAARRSA